MSSKRKPTVAVAHRRRRPAAGKRLAPKARQKIYIYVPKAFNTGEPVPADLLRILEDLVMQIFSGCTLHLHVLGAWLSDAGLPAYDPLLLVEVEAEDSPTLMPALLGIVRFICEHFEQEAVFITIADVSVLSVRRSDLATV